MKPSTSIRWLTVLAVHLPWLVVPSRGAAKCWGNCWCLGDTDVVSEGNIELEPLALVCSKDSQGVTSDMPSTSASVGSQKVKGSIDLPNRNLGSQVQESRTPNDAQDGNDRIAPKPCLKVSKDGRLARSRKAGSSTRNTEILSPSSQLPTDDAEIKEPTRVRTVRFMLPKTMETPTES